MVEADHRPITYTENGGTVVYRASALGGCIQALVASRLGYNPVPPDANTRALFAKGNEAERTILEYLRIKGWKIYDEQKEVAIRCGPNVMVRGHIDALGVPPNATDPGLIECKYMGDDTFSRWRSGGIEALPRYAWQTSVYLHALRLPKGRVVVQNIPEGGEPNVVVGGEFGSVHSLGAIRRRVLLAESWVKRGQLPSCDTSFFPCPFYYLHEEKQLPLADALLDSLIERAIHIGAIIKEKQDILTRIRTEIGEWLKEREISSVRGQGGKATFVHPTSYDYAQMIRDHDIDKSQYKKEGTPYIRITADKEDDPNTPTQPPPLQ